MELDIFGGREVLSDCNFESRRVDCVDKQMEIFLGEQKAWRLSK